MQVHNNHCIRISRAFIHNKELSTNLMKKKEQINNKITIWVIHNKINNPSG
jgi:hypothetical protein